MDISVLVLPVPCDFDAVVAAWIYMEFDEGAFSDGGEPEIEFMTPSERLADKRPGVLHVGFEARTDVSVTLAEEVARRCGAEEAEPLKKILGFTHNVAVKGAEHAFDIAGVFRRSLLCHSDGMHRNVQNVFDNLDVIYEVEEKAFEAAEKALYSEVSDIVQMPGKNYNLVVYRSDGELALGHLFRREEFNAGVVLNIKGNGSLKIYSRREFDIDLRDVLRLLRIYEQKTRFGRLVVWDWKKLEQPGALPEVSMWCYDHQKHVIFGGLMGVFGTVTTCLTVEDVMSAIMMGLDLEFFPEDVRETCRQGICVSTPTKSCSVYSHGLRQCRRVRYNMIPGRGSSAA